MWISENPEQKCNSVLSGGFAVLASLKVVRASFENMQVLSNFLLSSVFFFFTIGRPRGATTKF